MNKSNKGISIVHVTIGRRGGKFSQITLCGTGLRFGRDVRKKIISLDESHGDYSVYRGGFV